MRQLHIHALVVGVVEVILVTRPRKGIQWDTHPPRSSWRFSARERRRTEPACSEVAEDIATAGTAPLLKAPLEVPLCCRSRLGTPAESLILREDRNRAAPWLGEDLEEEEDPRRLSLSELSGSMMEGSARARSISSARSSRTPPVVP